MGNKNFTNYSNYSKNLKENAPVDKLSYEDNKQSCDQSPNNNQNLKNAAGVNSDRTEQKKAIVDCARLNFRRSPSKDESNILYVLNKNEEVDILEELSTGFSKVSAKGVTGYVVSKFISVK